MYKTCDFMTPRAIECCFDRTLAVVVDLKGDESLRSVTEATCEDLSMRDIKLLSI